MSTLRQQIEDHVRASDADLTAAGLAPLREVAGAAGLKNILGGRVSAPGCYVYRHSLRAAANQYDDGVEQVLTEQYAMVIVLRNLRDSRQGDASDQAEGYSEVLRQRILTFRPDPAVDDFVYAGGQLVTLQNNYYHWQDLYATRRILRY